MPVAHLSFKLHTLRLPVTGPHELAVVTALCLYSIWMRYQDTDGYDGEGMPSYHADAVDSMVRGAGVWHQTLRKCTCSMSTGARRTITGIRLELGMDFVFRLLDRLILEEAVVHNWAVNTKLSSLRTLMISRTVGYKALNSLLLLGSSFQCLTTLLFTCAQRQVQAYYDDVKRGYSSTFLTRVSAKVRVSTFLPVTLAKNLKLVAFTLLFL